LPDSITLKQPIGTGSPREDRVLFLVAGDAGDGRDEDVVIGCSNSIRRNYAAFA